MSDDFLLFEIANVGLVGLGLNLVSDADPADGFFNAIWVKHEQRKDWLNSKPPS